MKCFGGCGVFVVVVVVLVCGVNVVMVRCLFGAA